MFFIHIIRNGFLSALETFNWCYTLIKVACVPFSFVNRSWLPTVIAVSAPCKRPANALQTPKDSVVAPWDRGDYQGSSVWSRWGRNGINNIRFRRSANTVDSPWGRSRDVVTSPYTWGLCANATAYSGVLAAIICVPAACARRPSGALGDLTALLLRCRCEPTAFPRRSLRSPWGRWAMAWHGVLGNPTASSGDVTATVRLRVPEIRV